MLTSLEGHRATMDITNGLTGKGVMECSRTFGDRAWGTQYAAVMEDDARTTGMERLFPKKK